MSSELMHALRVHERGGPEKLAYERAPLPVVGIGDALVRVHACSITPTELDWPSTWVDRAGHDRRPVTPGHEFSGVVTALGPGSVGAAVGDQVYGLGDWYRDGAAAEYVAVEVRNLAPKPKRFDHLKAATVPLAALTAWQAVFEHGRLAPGQSVLIHGAAGGVGTFAVQIARAAGGRVVATGRSRSRELVESLGAHEFIDVDERPFEQDRGSVDLVLDLVGGELVERSWGVLKPGGLLVSIVDAAVAQAGPPRGKRGVFFVVEPRRSELTALAQRIDAGELRAVVGAQYPLARGREAFDIKRARGVSGKVVLQCI
jgi:NADPH:quinone reductase-like Zn-dependent oxidoreductase